MSKIKNSELRLFLSTALFFIAAAVINRMYGTPSTSDMVAHLRFAEQLFTDENVISYPLFHILVLLLEKIVSLKWAGILVQSGCYVITYLIVEYIMKIQVLGGLEDINTRIDIQVYSFLFAFLSPIYLPWILPNIYLGQGGLQIWHNPTMTIAMPFALMLVYLFMKLFEERDQNIPAGRFLIFALLFCISNLAKPSFYIVFAPSVFLFLVVNLIFSKFQTMSFCIKIGFSFIPATVIFLWQSVFFHDHSAKFSFSISPCTAWRVFTPNILLSILVALAFPLAVIVLCPKEAWKDKGLLLGILLNITAIIEFIVFTDGTQSGNFAWGYYMAQYVLFIYAFVLWCKMKPQMKEWKNLILLFIFFLHLFSGICYLFQVCINGKYCVIVDGRLY